MPIFNYHCKQGCKKQTMKQGDYSCEHGQMSRETPTITTTSVEVIDNGLMVRKIETYVGASEMVSERAANDPRVMRELDGQA